MIKDRTPEAAATHFSLNPDKYHRLPDILDSIAHFHYFLHLHGSEPIPKVTLEMHTLEGPFENREVSNDIFHNNVAEVKEGKKYGFTFCNGSPHALFVYLFYFDPDQCTIQVRLNLLQSISLISWLRKGVAYLRGAAPRLT
jgi:hypothetical protein